MNSKAINNHSKILLLFYFYVISPFVFSQELYTLKRIDSPNSIILSEIENFKKNRFVNSSTKLDSTNFNLSFNINYVRNNGHPNIDNSSEVFALGKQFKLISARFSYYNKWIILAVEPYSSTQENIFEPISFEGNNTFRYNNNHSSEYKKKLTKLGFRQSLVALHYKGIGIGYGKMSHWWSPGFHSSLTLSSNAPSQESFVIGSLRKINFNRFSFNTQIILMPNKNKNNDKIYFSGLRTEFTFQSYPIITFGFHRTFLSGEFDESTHNGNSPIKWSKEDAVRLVLSPLFNQSKRGLDYVIPGTPGFDIWDELLSAFIVLNFPKENFEIYVDIASDDSRGNFSDLKAHWDHTLGYTLGVKKFFTINNKNYLLAFEHLSTTISNTFNSKFYRGDSTAPNFYLRGIYDYFTFENRRMGAHSGSSSEDFYLLIGLLNNNTNYLLSYNKEIHGLKSMNFPEQKDEYALSILYKHKKHQNFSINIEREKIRNYAYTNGKISHSTYIWLSYSFKI